MTLYDYQQELIDKINAKSYVKRLCVQLATGGGKTVIFSEIARTNNLDTLVLVDADELVEQTAATLANCCTFQAKNKRFPLSRVIVAMSQTVHSRAKNDSQFLSRFRCVIVDEAHVFVHNKIFDLLHPDCMILGFTATPVRSGRVSFFDEDGEEWTKEQTMSEVYQDIVCGIGIDKLIERGFLVDEELYTFDVDNLNKLKTNADGEFTSQSLNDVFDNENYCVDVLAEYRSKCEGRKTLVFTPTTEVNMRLFKQFTEAGYDCNMYDSVNSCKSERKPIVDWFRNTPNAILFNVGCFTKGFDVKDVECIILARAVGSLSLFIQIAGRGARTTDKIYKDRFVFIDGGGNSERFGMWSAPRDWEAIFWKGFKKPKKKKEEPLDIETCENCNCLKLKSEIICPACGFEKEVKEKGASKPLELGTVKVAKIAKLIYPDAKKIIDFCERRGQDKFDALALMNKQIIDLFKATDVSFEAFQITLKNGNFCRKMAKIMRPVYGHIINSNLPSKANRTYRQQIKLLINQLNKFYGKEN